MAGLLLVDRPHPLSLGDGVPSDRVITRRLPLAVAVAAGIAAAGCGTAGSDAAGQAQVKRTVQVALGDLAAGDGRAFCALATPAERARLARVFARGNCAAAMHGVGSGLSPAHRAALRHVEVSRVTVAGTTATVRAADIATPDDPGKGFLSDHGKPTTLVRRADGRWLING
jgi:hypothetical protein